MRLPRFTLRDLFQWRKAAPVEPATPQEVYETVERVLQLSHDDPTQQDLYRKLEATLHLGSSGLEATGAIGHVFRSERERINGLVGEPRVDALIAYVEKAHGQR